MKSFPVDNAEPGQTVIAVWHPRHASYVFYSLDKFDQLEKKLTALDPGSELIRKLQCFILGTAQEVIVEEDRTVSLPDPDNASQVQAITDE